MKTRSTTAGIIVIGNEILSGKVQDINSCYLTAELRTLGVSVMRILVIPDDIGTIGSEAAIFSKHFDYVFTTGGVGPTHDDVTMAGLAQGFRVNLVPNTQIRESLASKYANPLNKALEKMTEIPEGAEVVFGGPMVFPIVIYRNIYVFPGIPDHVKEKFPFIRERIRGRTIHLRKIYLNTDECEIAGLLTLVLSQKSDVVIGSYPITGHSEYRVLLTMESESERSLKDTFDDLLGLLPPDMVVHSE